MGKEVLNSDVRKNNVVPSEATKAMGEGYNKIPLLKPWSTIELLKDMGYTAGTGRPYSYVKATHNGVSSLFTADLGYLKGNTSGAVKPWSEDTTKPDGETEVWDFANYKVSVVKGKESGIDITWKKV